MPSSSSSSIDWLAVKPKKQLNGGNHSAGVWLLDGGTAVRKRVDLTKPDQKAAFDREAKILKYLTDRRCPHTPVLLAVDPETGTIITSYVGVPVVDTSKNRSEEAAVRKQLRRRWNVVQKKPGLLKKIMYKIGNNGYLHNVARDADGRMRLYDFGSKTWRIRRSK